MDTPGKTRSAGGAEAVEDPQAPIRPLVRNVIVAQDMVPVCSRMMKKTYGLSNRETDVLELIIRGRDVARMSETLFVSENTVRSHCKNLYRKLGVHNRQQVFDLVEEYREREECHVD
ncbi:response regulator transcription factor [Enteroscipio rubneri]